MRYLLICSVLVLMVLSATMAAAEIVLVVNKENPVGTIRAQDAKLIFLGNKKSWGNGDKITLYSQYDYVVRDAFAGAVLNKTGQQFATYWKKALFTGTGRPPVEVKNDMEMKRFIAADPRGIGYIDSASLDDSVKVVKIR